MPAGNPPGQRQALITDLDAAADRDAPSSVDPPVGQSHRGWLHQSDCLGSGGNTSGEKFIIFTLETPNLADVRRR